MRPLSRILLACAVLVACSAARAEALSVRDVIELSKAGVSDQVLLALIDVDHRVYTLDNAALKELKDAGVSERVVIAMIRSGRTGPLSPPPTNVPPVTEPQAPQEPFSDLQGATVTSREPQVIVIDHHDAADQYAETAPVAYAVPVFVPIQRHSRAHASQVPRAMVSAGSTYPVPNYPLGTLAPQQPFLTATQPGITYSMPNYPLGTIAPQQPFLGVTPVTTPTCATRISAGGAATLVCR
jgi:hypothetical protein